MLRCVNGTSYVVRRWLTVHAVKMSSTDVSLSAVKQLVSKMDATDRAQLLQDLQRLHADELIADYQGKLASVRWRSRLGRPSKVNEELHSNPTGQFCEVPGDYIDFKIGVVFGFSTMAAAALGNTISDVAGIGSAWYVENIAVKIGVPAPTLSRIQTDMKSARFTANFWKPTERPYDAVVLQFGLQHIGRNLPCIVVGRALGVTIGCLLGMIPLLFLPTKSKEDDVTDDARA
ncbi:unnamed protein product [Notodromas monacha]|uniref:Transmembrane protein 65 n=1 Tax=Notodromas monacha TaxID=399045 RepID=A0A7R9GA44_9CRUS|nr:unnamed protein product [Notodromas monacha]CAG0914949.1 unnamed protein product [Notodromas monacha]